jgi:signal transduction histidine kinase/CheY-like chemotaxis protein
METFEKNFNIELRISYRYVLPILAHLGIAFAFLPELTPTPNRWYHFEFVGVLLYGAAGLAWVLGKRRPHVGKAVTICLTLCLVLAAYLWEGSGGLLALLSIPVALAAAHVNLRVMAATAVVSTLLVAFLTRLGLDSGSAALALASVWLTAGIMLMVYLPMYRVSGWFHGYYGITFAALNEARDQKAELKQTLNDLEHANLNLTRMNRLAQGLRQVAEEARAAKVEFVANVSHELRTPLNMITGFTELLLDSPHAYGTQLPPALLADLSVIYRNADHLSNLIDDVLDLSQIEAEHMALSKEYARIETLIETSLMAVQPLYHSKGLYLRADVAPDLPDLFCDQTRIREVLLNLLSNAGRFMEEGGTTVRAWEVNGMLRVSVVDTGPGIAPEDMNKLFKPFQQLDGSIRRKHGGTGLGLSITKHFIELHEGKIWVDSQLGVGTTFYFQLPVAATLPPMHTNAWRASIPDWEFVGRTQRSLAPRQSVRTRIVVLDGEQILRRLLSRYWDDTEIVPVRSHQEAVEELSRVPAQALIVNDLSVHGTDFRLPSSLAYDVPVFVCSVPGATQLSADLGVADRLIKPIARADLLASLEQLGVESGTVLIVDDEPDALQLFSRMLASSERSYRVLLARNGFEAIQILQDHRPNVILLDLVMPNMDGFELLERRKQESGWRQIPVVLISSRDASDQPIVSRDLTVTLSSGLSAAQLLSCIRLLSKSLAPPAQVDDRVPPEAPRG